MWTVRTCTLSALFAVADSVSCTSSWRRLSVTPDSCAGKRITGQAEQKGQQGLEQYMTSATGASLLV